ncbi:MAG: DUF1835 domain-containing protein [Alphaproteobacteria bacterium]|nr:DUF1835 domain-containing protein [Alphaproteobacteria bacterium]MCZ6849401.1 DUF1835 domain-containing protein [Alphaproteobacteria bacterium]
MDLTELSRALHIVGGDTAAGSLKAALRLSHDRLLVNVDPLSCGPAPDTDDLGVWRSTREKFLRDLYIDWPDFSFDDYEDNGLLMNAKRLSQEDDIVVWAGLGLPDQLLLAWVIFLFDRLRVDISKLWVVQFEKLRPRQRVLSIGELEPEDIRNYCPEPRQLDSQDVEELRRAWRVYRSDDPTALSKYVTGGSPLPILHRALSQLLYRYPDVRSGVGVWDQRLLHYSLEKGPAAALVIGFTMGYSESPDCVGDTYLFRRLIGMGNVELTSPLISVTGSTRTLRGCEVRLTTFGQSVLSGKANNVHENGIDDWIGGVHLRNHSVTFRDGDHLLLSH